MRKSNTLSFTLLFLVALLSVTSVLKAQNTPFGKPDSAYKVGAWNLWGYNFSDFYYKGHADTAGTFNTSYHGRGGSNQYTGVPAGHTAFQSRRIYLGFDYNLSKHFSTEFLLADEDNYNYSAAGPAVGASGLGNLDAEGKSTFYLKLANVRWKNIWNGTDFVFGQQSTPSFPLLSEVVWGYRSIERTVSDIRRTNSYDFGAGLNGTFDPKTRNFGYDLLVANGSAAKPVAYTNNFRFFYGDIWAKLFDKHLLLDLYADYNRNAWTPTLHQSRQMVKGFIAYTAPKVTIGVEGFINTLKNGATLTPKTGTKSTATASAEAISAYVRGKIVGDKLGFFARYDQVNPDSKITASNIANFTSVTEAISNYTDPAAPNSPVHESFVTAGLDFTPIKNVHFMPNVWYDHYHSMGNPTPDNHDIVYRMTIYFIYGK